MKKYLAAILLLLINLYNYQYGLNPLIFFILSCFIVILTFYFCKKENVSTLTSLIELMCFSWPISWINIFGQSASKLQVTWFYIFGLLIFLNILLSQKKFYKKNKVMDVLFYTLLFFLTIPLLIAHSIIDGIADFIMILFFTILTFIVYQKNTKITNNEYHIIIKSLIFINVVSALIIIFQHLMYTYMGMIFFKMNFAGSFSKSALQVGCELLFEDASSATIMLGCGVIFSLIEMEKNKINLLYVIIILIGLALTSRRTGVIALLLILIPFFLFHYKGSIKKIVSIGLLASLSIILIYFMSISRPFDQVKQLFYDNGRFQDYITSINLIFSKPYGVGYGDRYLASIMTGGIIPHNTFLRWMNFGGIFLAIPLLSIIIYCVIMSYKKNNKHIFWALLYTCLAMNFIPDILNARFLTILCIVALIYEGEGKRKNDKKENFNYSSSL